MGKSEYALIGAIGSAVVGVGISVYSYFKQKKSEDRVTALEEKLEAKIDGVADGLEIEVPEEIVINAVKRAADGEASKAVKKATEELMAGYRQDIRIEVRKIVDLAYENAKADVKTELERQVSNVDISGIKKTVIDEASEKAKKKLDSELEAIANKFSNDLESSSKILKLVSDKLGTTT